MLTFTVSISKAMSNSIFLPLVSLCALALLTTSCEKEAAPLYSGPGKKPVYATVAETRNIQNKGEQPVEATGGIFLLDTLFFLAEQRKGIHVYNVANPEIPVYLTFFSIPAMGDFTISGNRLYADSWRDLITLDISDIYAIREIDRVENVFTPLLYPTFYNGWFECIDEANGAVVGWEDATLKEVKCFTNN